MPDDEAVRLVERVLAEVPVPVFSSSFLSLLVLAAEGRLRTQFWFIRKLRRLRPLRNDQF
jgi:hypothetical protein